MHADTRATLTQEIVTLQRQLNTAAWRYAGGDVVLPDLTAQQLKVLLLVANSPGIASVQLSQHMAVSAATSSGIVERMVDRGLLRRDEDPDDRRVRRLSLTDAGEALLGEFDAANELMFQRLVPLIPTDTLKSIHAAYLVLLDALAQATAQDKSDRAR